MLKRFLKHQVFLSILILSSLTSCKGQVKTNLSKDKLNNSDTIIDNGLGLPKTSAEMKSSLEIGIDPYSVETKDTISTKGPQ